MHEENQSKHMSKRLVVIAMEEEKTLLGNHEFIVMGEGAINAISSLEDISRDTPILNVGYVGSNLIQIGTRVRIGKVALYHPHAEYEETTFVLDGDTPCYTSSDFVIETSISEPCVFDMELAYILAMGFTDVIAEKVVSDNLSVKQFHEAVRKDG